MEVLLGVKGDKAIEERFKRFERNVTEAERTMALVGETIKAYNERNWGRGIKDAPTTDQRWPDHTPLDNTGALKASMKVREITPTSVTYGTNEYYARFLQYGTKKMTKKRVLKFPRKAVAKLIQRRIFDGVT